MAIGQKYNTKAAALYRDKVATIAAGKPWSASNSAAQKHVSSSIPSYSSGGGGGGGRNEYNSFQNGGGGGGGYQDSSSGGAVNYKDLVNTPEFKDQKQQYFNKMQEENAMRPE